MTARASIPASELLVGDERVVHRASERARRRSASALPADLPGAVRDVLERSGISDLHRFQQRAIELVRQGRHVVLAGGTGAGKSLCYQLPLLEALAAPREDRKQTALYLAPTKSLAQDQARRLRELDASWARPLLYDGDTPPRQRAQVRRTANLLLTNPDMLSAGILPGHAEWSTFLRGLSIVVVDEAHVYRGVFGSHVAQVLRRLRRLLAHYGNTSCTFVLSSATTGNPIAHAERLTGLEFELVDDDGAPRAARDLVLWNPELDEETGDRDSALGDASRIYGELLERGVATIVFARSRKSCELIHRFTRDWLASRGLEDVAARIAPYRAGYTPEERRQTERALASGELLGVVATSALELGIDIGSLEASIVVTYPGTTTSLLQRWGRAARTPGRRGLCVLIAGDDALDQYFMRHPDELLDREVEAAIVSVRNPRIVLPHVAAAAAELPIGGPLDVELWDAVLGDATTSLVASGELRETPAGHAFVGRGRPGGGINLRSTGRGDVAIVDTGTGQLLGTVEIGRAASSVYPGAVYLHRGESYLVEHLDVGNLVASVTRSTLPYYTLPKLDTDIEVVAQLARRDVRGSALPLVHGRVVVTDQLVGYQRLDAQTHRVLDLVEVTLPPLAFDTEAVWFPSPVDADERLLGSLHAAEHGLIAMLPLIATCDRWDIGGLSIDWHDAFDGAGIFVYDGHPGGIGIVEAGFGRFEHWATIALSALEGCPCDDGCPSCVQSPKCGNLNEPLDKAGAIGVLAASLGIEVVRT
jgi:DEAD/DEAH box helicase domain-containing protein